jgi:hypothetical protein
MGSNPHPIFGRGIETETTTAAASTLTLRERSTWMTTLTTPTTADRPNERSANRLRDLVALTGGLFVLAVVGAFIVGGDTPKGDAGAEAVIAHYTENRTQGIIASLVLALAAVPALAFAARLRERARLALGADRTLPNFAFASGVVMAMGFLGAAAIHLALADYARDLEPAGAQALNSLDADSFLLFTTGIATLVLAGSLIALRSPLLPAWLGWTGIPVAIAIFTPVGFFAACLGGVWIIATSLLLYARGEQPDTGGTRDRVSSNGSTDTASSGTGLAPTAFS